MQEEEKSDPDKDSISEEDEEEENKGYLTKWFGKVKNAFTLDHLVDFVVGGFFDKDEDYELDLQYENDALDNGLSFTKMKKVVEKKLPRKNDQRYPVCSTNTGWHCCCKRYRKTDMAELGIGLSLYFKMIKYFITLFLLFTIISIPAYIFYTDGDGLCATS